jgi:hypothetical protein
MFRFVIVSEVLLEYRFQAPVEKRFTVALFAILSFSLLTTVSMAVPAPSPTLSSPGIVVVFILPTGPRYSVPALTVVVPE